MKILVCLVMLTGLAAPALADGPLSASLEARRIGLAADGSERRLSAEGAVPGDLIEYRAIYRNASQRPLRGVVATLPVPADCEYVPGSAGRGVLASLDGKSFAPVPLMRRVRLADGREHMQAVPASEYRYLRWTLGSLHANGSSTVSARVRVSAAPNSATLR